MTEQSRPRARPCLAARAKTRAARPERRPWRLLAAACCLGALLAAAPGVRAEEPSGDGPGAPDGRAVAAPIAGALTVFIPLVVGSALVARDDNRALQRDGIRVMVAGFAAAPIVSHAVAGRWRRALVFGLASVATSAATLVAMSARDPFDPMYLNRQRLAFGFLFSASFAVGAGGVIDSFVVGPAPRVN